MLLQIIKQLGGERAPIKFNEISLPGRTPKALSHEWQKIKAEVAASGSGGDGTPAVTTPRKRTPKKGNSTNAVLSTNKQWLTLEKQLKVKPRRKRETPLRRKPRERSRQRMRCPIRLASWELKASPLKCGSSAGISRDKTRSKGTALSSTGVMDDGGLAFCMGER